MRAANKVLRIAVGEPHGRRSSTWRIWFGPQDVYAGFRTLSGVRKVSIHFPRPNQPTTLRYIGFTKDFAEQDKGELVDRQQRTHMEWPGIELGSNYFLEFRFRIPESELRPLDPDGSEDILWVRTPPVGGASEVTILSGPPIHVGLPPQRDDGGAMDCLGEFQLDNGRFVWVMHHHIACPPEAVVQSWRDEVEKAIKEGTQPYPKIITPNARVGLTMNCGDGSAAEVEIAADFLRAHQPGA